MKSTGNRLLILLMVLECCIIAWALGTVNRTATETEAQYQTTAGEQHQYTDSVTMPKPNPIAVLEVTQ
jgi:hypothetical protein